MKVTSRLKVAGIFAPDKSSCNIFLYLNKMNTFKSSLKHGRFLCFFLFCFLNLWVHSKILFANQPWKYSTFSLNLSSIQHSLPLNLKFPTFNNSRVGVPLHRDGGTLHVQTKFSQGANHSPRVLSAVLKGVMIISFVIWPFFASPTRLGRGKGRATSRGPSSRSRGCYY